MYKIVGGDGVEYGPVSLDQVQKWIAEGRVDAQTRIKREGFTDWMTVADIPELMSAPLLPPVPVEDARTDKKATASLVFGILSVTILWALAAIPAIILGHISRSSIRKSLGQLKGERKAFAGLVMGYISLAISVIFLPFVLIVLTIALPSLLRSRQAANEFAAIANLRTINTAEVTFLATSGGNYGDLNALVAAGLLDNRFGSQAVSGYTFTIVADRGDYTAYANPTSSNTGRFGYISWPDGVVRYSVEPLLAPSQMAGLPIDDVGSVTPPAFLGVSRARQGANESAAVANLRTINTAEVTYLSSSGGNYGDIKAMVKAGLLDPRFNSAVSGYNFTIVADGGDYTAEARPVSADAGRFGYWSSPDGVVRYSTDTRLAPAGQAAMPVQ